MSDEEEEERRNYQGIFVRDRLITRCLAFQTIRSPNFFFNREDDYGVAQCGIEILQAMNYVRKTTFAMP